MFDIRWDKLCTRTSPTRSHEIHLRGSRHLVVEKLLSCFSFQHILIFTCTKFLPYLVRFESTGRRNSHLMAPSDSCEIKNCLTCSLSIKLLERRLVFGFLFLFISRWNLLALQHFFINKFNSLSLAREHDKGLSNATNAHKLHTALC